MQSCETPNKIKMMKYQKLLLGLLAAALLPSLALAKPSGATPGKKGQAFSKLDSNGDQIVTLQEAEAAGAKRLIENFNAVDSDGSGGLTQTEMRDRAKQQMQERQARRAAMDADGNGLISKDEAANAGAKKLVEHFDTVDGNGDGELGQTEMKEMRKVMRQKQQQNKQS